MNHELEINHVWSYSFAHFDEGKLREGKFMLYLGGQEPEDDLKGAFREETGCTNVHEYLEKYLEQILSHETLHVEIFKAFRDGGTEQAINATNGLDKFDNWSLNPISFQSLS